MVIHPAKSLRFATMASYSGRTGGRRFVLPLRLVLSPPQVPVRPLKKRCHCPPSLRLLSDFLLASSNTHSPDCRGDSCNLTRNTSQNIECGRHTHRTENLSAAVLRPCRGSSPPVVPVPVPALYFSPRILPRHLQYPEKFLADFAAELDLPCSDQPIEA